MNGQGSTKLPYLVFQLIFLRNGSIALNNRLDTYKYHGTTVEINWPTVADPA